MDCVAASGRIATVIWSLRLTGEAALPGHNFNDATRDRRFLLRLAVPPSLAAA
jgi:hypothetical protein